MADAILTSKTGLTTPAGGDFVHIVDISDSTDNAAGTSKKITYTNLVAGILTEQGITASITELNYVDGVTSAIQTQMDLKAPLASPTFTGTVSLPADSVNAITEIASGIKSGADGTLVTGTAGTASDLAIWNGDGDLVDGPTPPSGTIVGTTDTQTLTNKRNTKRVVTTTDDATAVIDIDIIDDYELTAIANATTFTLTGTPTDGQVLIVRFKDAGVTKGLTWTGFTVIGVTLPTDTTAGKWHYVGCKYNLGATAWHVLAVVEQV
ncbi:MAG TPA: hypothetical protein ENI23_00275 [bacterium]|nr:hypothetical protein [bacterium]